MENVKGSNAEPCFLLASADEAAAVPIEAALAAAGAGVVRAWDGEQALRRAVELTPAAILLDRYLPVIDGLAVAAELRADPRIPAATPIVLLSSEPLEARQRDKAGVTAVFPKSAPAPDWREFFGAVLAGKNERT